MQTFLIIQGIMAKTEDYSIEDLNDLIKRVQNATSFSENQIEAEINRSYGYLAQTRSRGKVPVALYKLLQSTFKDALQNTRPENGTYKNANGPNNAGPPVDEVVKAKDQTIAALTRSLNFLEAENARLAKQCEVSLAGLNLTAHEVYAAVRSIMESQGLLKAAAQTTKVDPKKIDAAEAEVRKQYEAYYKESVESKREQK